MDRGKPKFDYEKCSYCTACIYTCPFGCIEKKDMLIRKQTQAVPALKDEKKCTGCGMCKEACPVDAIEIMP